MIRLALLLLANLSLGAADKPAGRSFLMLGGLTQIIDASGKVTWKYPAVTRDKKVVWSYTDATNQGVHEFQLLDEAGKPLTGVLR